MAYFVHNGHRLFYREQGSGPLLLILPGNTGSSACHQGELYYFGQSYRTIVIDFWGTGQSDRVTPWPDDWWEQGAHDVAGLIAHLGEQQALVMGTSGGGWVALLLAILHPEKVTALIADSVVERHLPTRLRAEVAGRSHHTPDVVNFWHYAHGDDWKDVVDADSDLLLRLAARGGDLFHGRIRRVRCPVLLTGSLRDASLPDVGKQLVTIAEQLRFCRVFLMSDGEHPLMWTRPGDFRQVSEYFLRMVLQERGAL